MEQFSDSAKLADRSRKAVIRVDNTTVYHWDRLMAEVTRHIRCYPNQECLDQRGYVPNLEEALLLTWWIRKFGEDDGGEDDGGEDDGGEDDGGEEDDKKPADDNIPKHITYELIPIEKFDDEDDILEDSLWLRTNWTTTPLTPHSFPKFHKLPDELRRMIWLESVDPWTLAVLPTVMLSKANHPTGCFVDWNHHWRHRGSFDPTEPATMRWFEDIPLYHVCSEARSVAISWYGAPAPHPQGIPFNAVKDTIIIGPARALTDQELAPDTPDSALPLDLLNRAQNVIVSLPHDGDNGPYTYLSGHQERTRALGYAQYIWYTFPSTHHLTFTFPPFDDCAMRRTVQQKSRGGRHIPRSKIMLFANYNPFTEHVHYGTHVSILDAFARLSIRDADHETVRVPFPTLRTVEVAWDQDEEVVCTHGSGMPFRTTETFGHPKTLALLKGDEKAKGHMYPAWVRVPSDRCPTVQEVVKAAIALRERELRWLENHLMDVGLHDQEIAAEMAEALLPAW